MHGRLLSSRGQHHAFLGRSSAAEADFAAALAVFGRLSDPVVVAQEQRQTATYRAIAALDNPALRVDERRALSLFGDASASLISSSITTIGIGCKPRPTQGPATQIPESGANNAPCEEH